MGWHYGVHRHELDIINTGHGSKLLAYTLTAFMITHMRQHSVDGPDWPVTGTDSIYDCHEMIRVESRATSYVLRTANAQ